MICALCRNWQCGGFAAKWNENEMGYVGEKCGWQENEIGVMCRNELMVLWICGEMKLFLLWLGSMCNWSHNSGGG